MITEIMPNIDVIANQSQSFFFPTQVKTNEIDYPEYKVKSETRDQLKEHPIFKYILPQIDLEETKGYNPHTILDMTMNASEFVINMFILFGYFDKVNSYDTDILQFIRAEGIYNTLQDAFDINDEGVI